MSKAFYKPSAVPQLVYRHYEASTKKAIEVWTTSCIVQNFGKQTPSKCTVLINPSNPGLSGTKNFPYFPRGGPVPNEKPMSMHKDWQPMGHVSQWGGMEVGTGMLFPVSVVDGLVHQLGGWRLEAECAMKRTFDEEPCPAGSAVKTNAPGELNQHFDAVVHTTPPFYNHCNGGDPLDLLKGCYRNALDLAFSLSCHRVAVPLLGAGARGFPENVATNIAASASKEWCKQEALSNSDAEQGIIFGLLEQRLADELIGQIKFNLQKQ